MRLLSVSPRNIKLRRAQSLFLSVMFLANNLPGSLRKDKIVIVSYLFNVFVEIWFLIHLTSKTVDKNKWL